MIHSTAWLQQSSTPRTAPYIRTEPCIIIDMNRVNSGGVKKFYAVKEGRRKGVFETWAECELQVKGYKGGVFKSFPSREEAAQFAGIVSDSPGAHSTWAGNGDAGGAPAGVTGAASSAAGSGRSWQNGSQGRWTQQPMASGGGRSFATAAAGPGAGPRPRTSVVAHSHAVGAGGSVEECAWAARDAALSEGAEVQAAGPSNGAVEGTQWGGAPSAASGARCGSAAEIISGARAAGEAVELLPGAEVSQGEAYVMHFDGASRGNPGKAGAGAVLAHEASGREVAHIVYPLPYGSTNNEAEYCGLIAGISAAIQLGIRTLRCKGDSKLVVQQVNGVWQVRTPHIQAYVDVAQGLLRTFYDTLPGGSKGRVSLEHVLREFNKVADRLSNEAVDMQQGGILW